MKEGCCDDSGDADGEGKRKCERMVYDKEKYSIMIGTKEKKGKFVIL